MTAKLLYQMVGVVAIGAGLGLLIEGAHEIWPPLAWVVAGSALLAIGVGAVKLAVRVR